MRYKKHVSVGLIVIILAVSVFVAVQVPRWHSEADIREAAYRYLFTHNYSYDIGIRVKAYYLAIYNGWTDLEHGGDWGDPSPSFLNRFRAHKPAVWAESKCAVKDAMDGVRDPKTRGRGIIIITGRIRWLSRDLVEIEGGYYEGAVSASGNLIRLKRENLHWVVVSDKMLWIS